jgi:hypothetical protein
VVARSPLGAPLVSYQTFLSRVALSETTSNTQVTNNTAEFERVSGLAIANWTTPPRRRR